MQLGKLTAELQTICHEGHSLDEVKIKILDAYYSVEDIKLMTVSKDDNSSTPYVIIDTKCK